MALIARADTQAQKFGTEMAIPDEVTGLEPDTPRRGHSRARQVRADFDQVEAPPIIRSSPR